MYIRSMLAILLAVFTLSSCNKSSPPPQEPVKPRSIAALETMLRLPTP